MEQLKKLRIGKKYSYQDMANFLGVSRSYYWQIENEKRRLTYKNAILISKIFSLKPDDVFYKDFCKSKN
ncbi:MAG: helix-turn-helix domain-containing protein [Clostridium sp.]|nr:helix-turn-helix domain-containing protein [Clostridium sp.]MCM1444363.1 helix-turn-helix domain-containing protein [Candidatus Amulumruptor caecigallinarius]